MVDFLYMKILIVATAKWIKLAEPIKYLHWGSDYERAEVGVLSRHITIQGDADSDNTK